MGVIHKLKPEILSFIIENKQKNPTLSCRNLTALISEQFHLNVSKSSINAIFKENNLSMPIGRRKTQKKKFNMPALPIIEDTRAITLVTELDKFAQNQPINSPLQNNTSVSEVNKIVKRELALEEQRIEEEARIIKLQEEESVKKERELILEKQRLKDENIKIEIEEAAKKVQQEKLAKEDAERLRRETEEASRLEEAIKKTQQERLAKEAEARISQVEDEMKRLDGEAELNAEKERWARLAAEELNSKQFITNDRVNTQKEEINPTNLLPLNRSCSGAIFLKTIDCLIGGSKQINEVICKNMGSRPEDFFTLTQAIIFRSLFSKDDFGLLSSLVGEQILPERLNNYVAEIKQNKTISLEIARIISNVFMEARGIKVHFVDGSIVYLDSQLHSIWSMPFLPFNFTTTVYELKNSLNEYFFKDQSLVLLSAPGYDMPTKEFFNVLLNIGSVNSGPDNLTLYGNKLEEFEKISLKSGNNYSFVFGLWPRQFTSYRKVKRIGNFNLEHIEGIDKDFYLAEIEIDLIQPSTSQSITMQGCALKINLEEKIRVVILSSNRKLVNLNKIAQIYLNHWPNLDEGFGDFSRKVELFAYTNSTRNFSLTESSGFSLKQVNLELEEVFSNYIKLLDAYLRWYFLPEGYLDKDLSFTKENIYSIPVTLTANSVRIAAEMQTSQEKYSLKDLEYLMRRLNERQINFGDEKNIFYFESASK